MKRLYSEVVQGVLPPKGDPMTYEAKALAQRGHVPINAYFRSPSHNEGKAASNVVNKSSVGHGTSTTDQIDNRSQAYCQVPFVNEEVAQVPNHLSLELNADLPLKKNDDVFLDKGSPESMKENTVGELLSKNNDGSCTDKLTLMESDASDPLKHSLSNVNTDINDIKKRASSVCEGFDMQLEDDVLLVGSNDGVVTNKDESKSFKENTVNELLSEKNDGSLTDKLSLMESDASDPLSHSLNNVSTGINDVNRRASVVYDRFDLQLEDDVFLVGNNAGVLTDKDESTSSEENIYELLSEKNDGSLRDKLTLMESTATDPLSHSLSIVSTEINDSNKKASLVCDDFDMQLEDDVLLVENNDGVLTDKDESKSSEEDSSMKFNASDPLKHMANCTPCEVKVTNDEAILILDNSHLPVESSNLSWKNEGNLSNESSEFLKKSVTMESNTADHLNENHLNHVWSGTNFVGKEADDSNFLLKSVVPSGRMDHVMMDKDFNKSSLKGAIFEDDPRSHLLNLPRHANGISFTNEEAIMVFDRNHLQLETEILARKNDDTLTVKHSNESLIKDTILELEHDAIYPLKNQPRCTSNSTEYKIEEVSSVSNDSFRKLNSGVILGKNVKALTDKASDVSCKEQANLELSTELTLHCGEESIKESLCSYGNECEGDIVTLNGSLQETSIHCADVESIHNVEQASSFLVNNLLGFSQTKETTSKYLENGIGYSSNAVDATSSERASIVLTSGETVEETKPVSSLKPLAKGSFSAFRSSVSNLSSGTVVHEKPVEHNAHTECRSRSSFPVFNNPSYGNNASNMKLASSRSSLSSMESLGMYTYLMLLRC